MATLPALLARREAQAALAVWALLPTLFLFFARTLAVDPSTPTGEDPPDSKEGVNNGTCSYRTRNR